jgi:hypothetical protein
MARDEAAEPPAGAAVLAVLADLRYWADRGVRIAAVEPGDANGVRVGVRSHPTTAQRALCSHYSFPVACWSYPEGAPGRTESGFGCI